MVSGVLWRIKIGFCLIRLESSMRLFTNILFVVAQGAGVLNIEDSKQSGSK